MLSKQEKKQVIVELKNIALDEFMTEVEFKKLFKLIWFNKKGLCPMNSTELKENKQNIEHINNPTRKKYLQTLLILYEHEICNAKCPILDTVWGRIKGNSIHSTYAYTIEMFNKTYGDRMKQLEEDIEDDEVIVPPKKRQRVVISSEEELEQEAALLGYDETEVERVLSVASLN